MKQKMVIRVQMEDAKKRSKALKVVVGFPGVISAAIEGAEQGQIAVVGEGVDSIKLTSSLRKKMGSAQIVTVAAAEEKKKEEKEAKIEITPGTTVVNPLQYYGSHPQYYYYHDDYSRSDPCGIM